MKKPVLILLSIFLVSNIFIAQAQADELLNVQKGIDKNKADQSQTQVDLEQIKKDIAALTGPLYSTEAEVNEANDKVAKVRKDLKKVETDLAEKKETLSYITDVRNQQIKFLYMNPQKPTMELFFTSRDFSGFAANAIYQKKVVGESEDLIKLVNEEIAIVENTKSAIAALKKDLEKVAAEIQTRFAAIQSQFYSSINQENSLSQNLVQIEANLKNLTQKQKTLITKKLAASKRKQTIGDQVPPSTPLPNPGFSPAYAFASYGYPHRVGMNQYGAYGRAKAGQGYGTILRAYYSNVAIGKYSVPGKVSVAGVGKISFEEKYLFGISEMPRSWPMEALKAQAVAARTYALNWMKSNPGKAICTTQACQVYNPLNANCSGTYNSRWCSAVRATKGIVITQGGSPITAWYASTAGGYTLSSQEVWGGYRSYVLAKRDYKGSWPKGAYDKSSPWFHKAWGNSRCGGAYYPWLTSAQVTDLFNAALLSQKSSGYNKYLSPTDGCLGAKGWSASKVRGKLVSLGVKDVGNLSNVLIGFDGKGHTSSITLVSSKYPSGKTFSGNFFRSIYHLRSPGTLSFTSNLFDVVVR
ncbi:SpoIID/LytB domain-containing protein [Patescibacteria group bacterium]|nr:SpoIID/LytB domain-containing protein [Patescibacteria group bacterium]